MEKVGNFLKEDLAKPGYKSKLSWCSHGLPISGYLKQDRTYTWWEAFEHMQKLLSRK